MSEKNKLSKSSRAALCTFLHVYNMFSGRVRESPLDIVRGGKVACLIVDIPSMKISRFRVLGLLYHNVLFVIDPCVCLKDNPK